MSEYIYPVQFAEDLAAWVKRENVEPGKLIVMRHDAHMDASLTAIFDPARNIIAFECDECEEIVFVILVARRPIL